MYHIYNIVSLEYRIGTYDCITKINIHTVNSSEWTDVPSTHESSIAWVQAMQMLKVAYIYPFFLVAEVLANSFVVVAFSFPTAGRCGRTTRFLLRAHRPFRHRAPHRVGSRRQLHLCEGRLFLQYMLLTCSSVYAHKQTALFCERRNLAW